MDRPLINQSVMMRFCLVLVLCLLCSCAHFKKTDPYEPLNRKVYALNDTLDTYILRPISLAYQSLLPMFVRNRVNHVFSNLDEPADFVNNLLLLDFRASTINVFRFAINSTVGLFGMFDVAQPFGLPPANRGFSTVFAFWIDDQSPYLMLPFMGPSTVYDSLSRFIRFEVLWDGAIDRKELIPLYVIAKRSGILHYDQVIQDAIDPYLFIRQAYLINRLNRLNALRIHFAKIHQLPPPVIKTKDRVNGVPINGGGNMQSDPLKLNKKKWIEVNGESSSE